MNFIQPLIGGLLIGVAVSIMLLFNGRVTGISGIVGGLIKPVKGDKAWRISFIAGLIFGGLLLNSFYPAAFSFSSNYQTSHLVIAGLLVGFGTLLGGGCTSGHGVCGISRLSLRSLVATVVFILVGMIIVYVFKTNVGSL